MGCPPQALRASSRPPCRTTASPRGEVGLLRPSFPAPGPRASLPDAGAAHPASVTLWTTRPLETRGGIQAHLWSGLRPCVQVRRLDGMQDGRGPSEKGSEHRAAAQALAQFCRWLGQPRAQAWEPARAPRRPQTGCWDEAVDPSFPSPEVHPWTCSSIVMGWASEHRCCTRAWGTRGSHLAFCLSRYIMDKI